MDQQLTLLSAGILLESLGLGVAVYALARGSTPEPGYLGLRGLRRREALEQRPLFAALEPHLRWHARWCAVLPVGDLRARVARLLCLAGDWLGLTADEFLALSVGSAIVGTALGAALLRLSDLPQALMAFFAGAGLLVPYLIVTGHASARQRQIDRSLPPAIDLLTLCMSAGLDFTAAMRQVVEKARRRDDPLREELEVILHRLALGTTREQALAGFAERAPTEPVKLLVNAVRQAERKGTPIAEVLALQAGSLRLRRSIAGEEAASRAAVAMLFPLSLILLSILLVLMGPFYLRSSGMGL